MSFVLSRVKKNAYYDSVRLMRIATNLQAKAGVLDAAIIVGTERNKEFLKDTNLFTDDVKSATNNDLCYVVEAESKEIGEQALILAESMLEGIGPLVMPNDQNLAYSLESALEMLPANLALISVPGMHVKREAMKCLERGLHLLIFSDNVSKADELTMKKRALELNLLIMGPDCGTAIINNIALGFANAIRPGPIGLVGASGTGLQEVTCLIDHLGLGISHAIGTGSNDVSLEIEAITMLQGIGMLANDPRTKVIVIISKPPSPHVAEKVIEKSQTCGKSVVIMFLGQQRKEIIQSVHFVDTMEEVALTAVKLAGSADLTFLDASSSEEAIHSAITKLAPQQKYVRGIFAGGTYTIESGLILSQQLGKIHTNTMVGERLADPFRSTGHTCVDLGDDLFTAGRPHPMLEPSVRNRRIVTEMKDPETAVILLDIVLGYGVHRDPARELLLAIDEGRSSAHYVPIVASVCGTDRDPQNRSQQVAVLEGAGVLVSPSNAAAARTAAFIVHRGKA